MIERLHAVCRKFREGTMRGEPPYLVKTVGHDENMCKKLGNSFLRHLLKRMLCVPARHLLSHRNAYCHYLEAVV